MTPAATADAVFRARKDEELANLCRLDKALALATGIVPEAATQTIKDRSELQLTSCRRKITDEATDCTTLREILDTQVRPVVAEVQAYVQGVLYRRAGLDNGVGAIAHRMLNDIAARAGVGRQVLIAVGEAEFIVHPFSMIRMRQRDATVWRLPILVHELGHHIAHNLRDADFAAFNQFPVSRYLKYAASPAFEHRHELFADVFATYVLGGAYPTCAIIQQARLDQGFHDHDVTHPSWPARVHTMLSALRAMSRIESADQTAGAFAVMADQDIAPMWAALIADYSDRSTAPTHEDLQTLQKLSEELISLLVEHAPARLRFQLGPAYELYESLTSRQPVAAPDGTTIAQVLDAAWRWRAHNIAADETTLTLVSDNALRWCAAAAE